MRPVWLEFPRDKNTYEMEDQFIVGNSLMVKPVTEQYATTTQLYLPGTNTVSVCASVWRGGVCVCIWKLSNGEDKYTAICYNHAALCNTVTVCVCVRGV